MLPPVSDLSNSLKNLKPSKSKMEGIGNFVSAIADYTNKVQAGPLGSPGILTFGNSAMVALMMAMPPVMDNSWIMPFANAWEAGILTAIITPGTCTNPAWIGSGGADILTLPLAPASIPTLSVAKELLAAGLASVGPSKDAPMPLAMAISNATMALTFLCIGLGPPPVFPPIPIPTPAM